MIFTPRYKVFAFGAAFVLTLFACAPQNEGNNKSAIAALDMTIEEQRRRATNVILEAQAISGQGYPLMWTYSDEDTTVHMIGSFHMLPADLNWRTVEMLQAFDQADTLVMESDILTSKGQSEQLRAVAKYGTYSKGESLSKTLGPELSSVADTYLQEGYNVPLSALDKLKPWFAGFTLAELITAELDMDPRSGVDFYFASRKGSREFLALETADEVFSTLDSIPQANQIEDFMVGVATLKESTPAMQALMDEWADGDEAGLELMLIDLMGEDSPAYQALLVERNKNWLPALVGLLDEPGNKFVVVGAAHMVGDDSIINLLESAGLSIKPFGKLDSLKDTQ